MDADRQQTQFAAASALQATQFSVDIIESPLGAQDELEPHGGEAGAAARPLEQHHTEPALDVAQAPAQGGLAHVQSFRRLPEAAVL